MSRTLAETQTQINHHTGTTTSDKQRSVTVFGSAKLNRHGTIAALWAHPNPVEQVRGNLKNRELANLCPDTVEEAAVFADDGLMRIGEDTRLCFSFLRHCGLSL